MPIVATIDNAQPAALAGFPTIAVTKPGVDGAFAASLTAAGIGQVALSSSNNNVAKFAKPEAAEVVALPLPSVKTQSVILSQETSDFNPAKTSANSICDAKGTFVAEASDATPPLPEGKEAMQTTQVHVAPSLASPNNVKAVETDNVFTPKEETTETNSQPPTTLGESDENLIESKAAQGAVVFVPTTKFPEIAESTDTNYVYSGKDALVAAGTDLPVEKISESRSLAETFASEAPKTLNKKQIATVPVLTGLSPTAANTKPNVFATVGTASRTSTEAKRLGDNATLKPQPQNQEAEHIAPEPAVPEQAAPADVSVQSKLPTDGLPVQTAAAGNVSDQQSNNASQNKSVDASVEKSATLVANAGEATFAEASHSRAGSAKTVREAPTAKTKHTVVVATAATAVSTPGAQPDGLILQSAKDIAVPLSSSTSNGGVPSIRTAVMGLDKGKTIMPANSQQPLGVDAKPGTAAEVKVSSAEISTDAAPKVDMLSKTVSPATSVSTTVAKISVETAVSQTFPISTLNPLAVLHTSSGVNTAKHEVGTKAASSHSSDDWTLQTYEAPSSNKLEIGVSGGSWGWLKVRAELAQGGGVHTYLRSATANAEGELRSQAGDLQTYLQAQQVNVQGVHVEASRSSGGYGDMSGFSGQGGQRRDDGEGQTSGSTGYSKQKSELQDRTSNVFITPARLNGAGGWLNVLA